MKNLPNFGLAAILMTAIAVFTSCEDIPANRNANLAKNQNINVATNQKNSSSPTPEIITDSPDANVTPDHVTAVTLQPTLTNDVTNVPPTNANLTNSNMSVVAVEKLIIPVAGIKPQDLRDTFKDARSENRVHDAIDIMAPQGAQVLAAADGEIARFFDSEKGGITIYQFSRDKKLIYYYAHLQRRADNLQEHQSVKQGTVIGYVGDTGNAGAGNFHLHFAIWTVDDPKHYWDGTNINPYPLLKQTP